MILVKVDVTKLKKEWFFMANSGAKFVDLALYENDEPDKFGNDWACKQSPPKEVREAGEKGHYVGNGKNLGGGGKTQQRPPQRPQPPAKQDEWTDDSGSEDSIPF
jgi:hypothetical protein